MQLSTMSLFSAATYKCIQPADEVLNHLSLLPQLLIDLDPSVYTLAYLRKAAACPEDHMDNEWLNPLRKAVLNATVASLLFHEQPMLAVTKISVHYLFMPPLLPQL